MVRTQGFQDFLGIDTRRPPRVADVRSLAVGKNVELTTGQALRRRDGRRLVSTLSADSVGLYSVDGVLHAVRPSTGGASPRTEPGSVPVFYDYVGRGFFGETPGTDTRVPEAVSASFVMGASPGFGSRPYLVLQYPGPVGGLPRFEHHLVDQLPPLAGGPMSTRIRLPFEPGASATRAYGKVWAEDRGNNAVRFSSALNGPTDWTLVNDAGVLPVSQHARGDNQVRAVASYSDNFLAVFFRDSLQIWRIDPDPRNTVLLEVLNGPGTTNEHSIISALGDMFFVGRGGVRSLQTSDSFDRVRATDDVGADIDALVQIESQAPSAALWSQVRSQAFFAFGTRIFVLTYLPGSQIAGWTYWDMPEPVEYMVEEDGELFYRSGNEVFQFAPDHDEETVDWQILFNPWYTVFRRRHQFLHFGMEGEAQIDFEMDGKVIPGFHYVGPSTNEKIPLGLVGSELALRFSGTRPWTLTQWAVEYAQLPR